MTSLRRLYHRHFGHHERFHLAVLVTLVVVAYVVVPHVVRLVDAVGGYAPTGYEPKDLAREEWLRRRLAPQVDPFTWDRVVEGVLLVTVALAWLCLVPGRGPRRSRRR